PSQKRGDQSRQMCEQTPGALLRRRNILRLSSDGRWRLVRVRRNVWIGCHGLAYLPTVAHFALENVALNWLIAPVSAVFSSGVNSFFSAIWLRISGFKSRMNCRNSFSNA